jgi:hypothetical protein
MPQDDALLFNKIVKELNATSSDRAIAVLGGSVVEAALRTLLLHHLAAHKDVTSYINRATISTLRTVAFGCGLIPQDLYADLKAISTIRDTMAHDYVQRSFDEPGIAAVIGRLIGPTRFGKLSGAPFKTETGVVASTLRDLPRRFQFVACIAAAATSLEHISAESSQIQESRRFYVEPKSRT